MKNYGIKTAIITGRQSEIVRRRAEELGIDYLYQGVDDKALCLKQLVKEIPCSLQEVIYMGDDCNDLPCMEMVGLACCPIDAHEKVKKIAGYIAKCSGGSGAVREVIDKVFNAIRE